MWKDYDLNKCSNICPLLSTHNWTRRSKLLECWGRQELYAPSYSFLLWVFLSTIFFKYPHKKKSRLDKSGDLGHHDTGPPQPIHLPGNMRFKWYLSLLFQCAGALSYWKNIQQRCLVWKSTFSSNADNLCCKKCK